MRWTRSTHAGLALGSAVVALFVVGTAGAENTQPGKYKIQEFAGPDGSQSGFFAIADDGTAVGQRLLADGTSHSILFGPHPFKHDPLAGRESALVAIDANDDAAGTLFVGTSQHPLFLSHTGKVVTLPDPGDANAIAIGPEVAATVTEADGQKHVVVWFPLTGKRLDRGPGLARGVNADGVVVGGDLNGDAAFWDAHGKEHTLGFTGELLKDNTFGIAVGFSTQSGSPKPVWVDLSQPSVVHDLKLPPGFQYGSAKAISDSGLIGGTAYQHPSGGEPSEGLFWYVRKQDWYKNIDLTDIAGVDDNGLVGGAAKPTTDKALEDAAVATPPVTDKLNGLQSLIENASKKSRQPKSFDGLLRLKPSLAGPLKRFEKHPSDKRRKSLCKRLTDFQTKHADDFDVETATFRLDDLIMLKLDLKESIAELKRELGC